MTLPTDTVCVNVRLFHSDRLSRFRTEHDFLHYGEFATADEFAAYRNWAREAAIPILILGNGSNILFKRRSIRALVLKNKIPKTLREIDAQTLEVSSSVMLSQVLKWCEERQLDSFYYLASVPATVGGAIAMNAGRGRSHNKTIFDFVQSVSYLEGDHERTLDRQDIPLAYRQTPFTGLTEKLILKVILKFPCGDGRGSPRHDRIEWSKENQDHSLPNCGSVFRESNWPIMKRMKGVAIATAAYSRKTTNWMLNSGKSPWPIVWLIRLTQFMHLLVLKRAKLELIEVD